MLVLRHAALSGLHTIAMGVSVVVSIDALIRNAKAMEGARDVITCREGCAHCCKQGVMIGPHEAALLVAAAQKNSIPIDRKRLAWQSHYETDEQWAARSEYNRRCVFLGDDNRCRVYLARPLACRKYFSLSEPSRCDIDNYRDGEVLTWFSIDAEIFATGVMTEFGADWLPRMVLRELDKEEQKRNEAG